MQPGMLASLAAIKPPLAWVERLDMATPAPLDVTAPEDDLSRELALCVAGRARVRACVRACWWLSCL